MNKSYSFKHWLPRVLLKRWELKNLDPASSEENKLIIYDVVNKILLDNKFASDSKKLPFGEKFYNNNELEDSIFNYSESKIGACLKLMDSDLNSFKNSQENCTTILYFMCVLMLRNKNTIKAFADSFKIDLLKYIKSHEHLKHTLKRMEFIYLKYTVIKGSESYVESSHVFNNKDELLTFMSDENKFFNFCKDMYWKYSNYLLLSTKEIYDEQIISGKVRIKDFLSELQTQKMTASLYKATSSCLLLSDYPYFCFELNNNNLVPLDIDCYLFSNYADRVKIQIDLIIIPINPSTIFIMHNISQNDLTIYMEKFLKNNKLSKNTIFEFQKKSNEDKILFFTNILSVLMSKEYIICPDKEISNNFINNILKKEINFVNHFDLSIKNHQQKKTYFNFVDSQKNTNYDSNSYTKDMILIHKVLTIISCFGRVIGEKKKKKLMVKFNIGK